jgi:hypothetical protein
MNCRRARNLIHDFIDGLINDQDRSALEQHLSRCTSCEREAEGLSKSLALLPRLQTEQLDENFAWKVRLAIARERNHRADTGAAAQTWFHAWNTRFAVSAASAFAVVAVAGYFTMTHFASSPVAGGQPIAAPQQAPGSDNVAFDPGENYRPPANLPEFGPGPGGVSTRTVASGSKNAYGNSGNGLIQQESPMLDYRQLVNQMRSSRVGDERMRNLQDQVDQLVEELNDCSRRCDGSDSHETVEE